MGYRENMGLVLTVKLFLKLGIAYKEQGCAKQNTGPCNKAYNLESQNRYFPLLSHSWFQALS